MLRLESKSPDSSPPILPVATLCFPQQPFWLHHTLISLQATITAHCTFLQSLTPHGSRSSPFIVSCVPSLLKTLRWSPSHLPGSQAIPVVVLGPHPSVFSSFPHAACGDGQVSIPFNDVFAQSTFPFYQSNSSPMHSSLLCFPISSVLCIMSVDILGGEDCLLWSLRRPAPTTVSSRYVLNTQGMQDECVSHLQRV